MVASPSSVPLTDPRAKSLPFMDNPLPTLGMMISYLLFVLWLGPLYMRDRKPMDLRRVIIFYNMFQVLLSGYMFYEVCVQLGTWA